MIDYPNGQDPDDFVRENGLAGFEKLTRYDAAEYRMLRAADDLDLNTQDGMTQYALRCCEILKKVKNPVEMENHLRQLVNQTGYDREILLRQIGVTAEKAPATRDRRPRPVQKDRPDDACLAERVLLTLLADGSIPSETVKAEDFSVDVHRRAAQWLLEGRSAAAFVETIEDENERSAAMQALNYAPLPIEHEDRMNLAQTSLRTIRQNRLRLRMAKIEEEIKTADSARKLELYTQMQAIMEALED